MLDTSYSLSVLFLNESSNAGDVCLFQTLREPPAECRSLVWLRQKAVPRTRLVFQWKTDFAFIWSNTVTTLLPGAVIKASQVWPADLSTTNQITLSYVPPYSFGNQTAGPNAGTLTIRQDGSVPARLGVVGIGMADQPTVVVPMQPNATRHFATEVRYWIVFTDAIAGESIGDAVLAEARELVFPKNVTSMSAILRTDNTWLIAPSTALSGRFARDADPA